MAYPDAITALNTNHEEADTKVAYMIQHTQQNNMEGGAAFVLHSPFAYIDLLVIFHVNEMSENKIYIDSGIGKLWELIRCLKDI